MALLLIICLETTLLVKSLFTEKKQELTKEKSKQNSESPRPSIENILFYFIICEIVFNKNDTMPVLDIKVETIRKVYDITTPNSDEKIDISTQDQHGVKLFFKMNMSDEFYHLLFEV